MAKIGKTKITFITAAVAILAAAVIYLPLLTAGNFGAAKAYGQESKFAYPIPIMQELTSDGEIDAQASAVIIRTDGNLNAISASGEVIAPLADLRLGDVTPVYYARNTAAANNIAQKLVDTSVSLAAVASDKSDMLKRMRSKATMVSGIMDCRSKLIAERADWDAVRKEANASGARSVILGGDISAECVRFLRRLSLGVWVEANSQSQLAAAVSAGATGILSDNPSQTRKLLNSLCAEVLPTPIIVAHRGLSGIPREGGGEYHENTVEAAWAAYTQGGADTVEIDIYLSADGELIVMHDPDLDRTTNGSGKIQNMTLSQIRQYKVIGSAVASSAIADPIPTLDDYMAKFKGEDCNLFIEIKGDKPQIMQALKAKIDEYDFSSQCTVIAFDASYLATAREIMPEVSAGLLYNYSNDNISSILRKTNPLNATFNPSYAGLDADEIAKYHSCGVTVWPWTFRNEDVFKTYYRYGAGGLTLDYCCWLNSWVKKLAPESYTFTAEAGKRFAISCLITRFGEGTTETPYSFIQTGGDSTVVLDENGYFTATEGVAEIVLVCKNAKPDYTAYSMPVTVTVNAPAQEIPVAPSNGGGSGCGGAAAYSLLPLGALMLLVAAALCIKRKKIQ